MRIIFFISKYNFQTGGGSTTELDCKARALQELGHEVSVVTVFSDQNQPFSVSYKVYEEQITSHGLLGIQFGINRLLKKYEDRADVFQVEGHFSYGSGWYSLFGSGRAKFGSGRAKFGSGRAKFGSGRAKPVLVHFNRELSSFPDTRAAYSSRRTGKQKFRYGLEKFLGARLINKNAWFTFTSPKLLEVYARFGLARKHASVMPDFFDVQEVRQQTARARLLPEARRADKSVWRLFSTGRMVKEKGFDVLIKALSCLPANLTYELTISGDGPESSGLKNLVRELGVADKVKFPGWISRIELDHLFQTADLFIIPRWRPELTSMLALEAMSFQIPYLVTKDTALSWQAGESALTFNDEDPEDCARAIVETLTNGALRERLSSAGEARVKTLDYRRLASKLAELIYRLKNKPDSQFQSRTGQDLVGDKV